jgi:hypothetical protein
VTLPVFEACCGIVLESFRSTLEVEMKMVQVSLHQTLNHEEENE